VKFGLEHVSTIFTLANNVVNFYILLEKPEKCRDIRATAWPISAPHDDTERLSSEAAVKNLILKNPRRRTAVTIEWPVLHCEIPRFFDLKMAARLPCETVMSENERQSQTNAVFNDTLLGRVVTCI